MAREWAKKFYNSQKWQDCRNAYIAERVLLNGGMCEICGENAGYIVHHIKHLNRYNISNPQITLAKENLQYVCKACHDEIDGHGLNHGTPSKCIFNADGTVTSRRECDRETCRSPR